MKKIDDFKTFLTHKRSVDDLKLLSLEIPEK